MGEFYKLCCRAETMMETMLRITQDDILSTHHNMLKNYMLKKLTWLRH